MRTGDGIVKRIFKYLWSIKTLMLLWICIVAGLICSVQDRNRYFEQITYRLDYVQHQIADLIERGRDRGVMTEICATMNHLYGDQYNAALYVDGVKESGEVFREMGAALGRDKTMKRTGELKREGGAFSEQETAFLNMLLNDLHTISEEIQRERKWGLIASMKKVNQLFAEFSRKYTFSNDDVWWYLKNL